MSSAKCQVRSCFAASRSETPLLYNKVVTTLGARAVSMMTWQGIVLTLAVDFGCDLLEASSATSDNNLRSSGLGCRAQQPAKAQTVALVVVDMSLRCGPDTFCLLHTLSM